MPQIAIDQEKIAEFCQRNHIRKLSLFGSAIREDFRADSDVDVLIEFEEGKGAGLLGLAHMEGELTGLVGGRKIDLRTPGDLSRYFRKEVVSSALVRYAKA
jgi:predicted nucleotidyltransferase